MKEEKVLKFSYDCEILEQNLYLALYTCLGKGLHMSKFTQAARNLVLSWSQKWKVQQNLTTDLWKLVLAMYKKTSVRAFSLMNKDKNPNYNESRLESASLALLEYYNTPYGIRKGLFDIKISKISQDVKDDIYLSLEHGVEIGSPFFICSTHEDCREAHKDLQGKLYYDENWKDYAAVPEVEEIIQNKCQMSIQKATSAPFYLMSGINCRHFFKNVSIADARDLSLRAILRKYHMRFGKVTRIARKITESERKMALVKMLNKKIPSKTLKGIVKKKKL